MITTVILLYTITSLVNVMLSTMKSILTVKANKIIATLINAISYSFYTIVVKQLADVSFTVALVVTFITNMIGVYTSIWIVEKISARLKKDKLWKISVTSFDRSITSKLLEYNIGYTLAEKEYKNKKVYSIDIFSENQEHSTIIKEILNKYNVKYHITEIDNRL